MESSPVATPSTLRLQHRRSQNILQNRSGVMMSSEKDKLIRHNSIKYESHMNDENYYRECDAPRKEKRPTSNLRHL